MAAADLVEQMPGGQRMIHAVVTLDIANTAANVKSAAGSVTGVSGAKVGDLAFARPRTETGEEFYAARVTAADTVEVKLINFTAGAINPASQIFDIYILGGQPQ